MLGVVPPRPPKPTTLCALLNCELALLRMVGLQEVLVARFSTAKDCTLFNTLSYCCCCVGGVGQKL
ncbi:hypothetical protein B0O99DRAFT_633899 [Bisporella sp. PMI_857]|nr:hypothetical protein B0O99DRAFT_633899 [Bisporella sp. PMI_857]